MIRRITSHAKKIWSGLALLSAEMIIVLIIFAISMIAFILITRHVFVLKDSKFDYQLFELLKPHVNDRNNAIVLFFTFLGTHMFLIPANIILIIYFLFIRKHRWYSIKYR